METKTKLFTILALFCVIFSACAVSAVDYNNGYYEVDYDDGYYEVDYDDGPYDDGYYDDIYDDDYYMHNAPQSQPAVNTSGNTTGNTTPHAAAGNAPAANNTLPATGLPIVALLGVCAVLGGAALYRRK